jgi:HEAT repeat protein
MNVALVAAILLAPLARRLRTAAKRRRRHRPCTHDEASFQRGDPLVIDALRQVGRQPSTDRAVLDRVVQLMRFGQPYVRLMASWACFRILCRCSDALERLENELSPEVRAIAVLAAASGKASPAPVSSLVRRALSAQEPPVRRAGLAALTRLDPVPFLEPLIERLSDRVIDIRLAASRLFAASAARADDIPLCQILSRIDPPTARTILAWLPPQRPRTCAATASIATDPSRRDRASAIALLGAGCSAINRSTLLALLDDPDPAVRSASAAAAAAAARSGYPQPLDRALVDRLIHLFEREPHTGVMIPVIDALASSLDPTVPAVLLQRIPASSGPVRERIVEASALFAQLRWAADRRSRSSIGA